MREVFLVPFVETERITQQALEFAFFFDVLRASPFRSLLAHPGVGGNVKSEQKSNVKQELGSVVEPLKFL